MAHICTKKNVVTSGDRATVCEGCGNCDSTATAADAKASAGRRSVIESVRRAESRVGLSHRKDLTPEQRIARCERHAERELARHPVRVRRPAPVAAGRKAITEVSREILDAAGLHDLARANDPFVRLNDDGLSVGVRMCSPSAARQFLAAEKAQGR